MRLAAAFTDLLYPARCISCRQKGSWICEACLLPNTIDPSRVCSRCGHLRAHYGGECDLVQLDYVRAAFAYSDAVRLLTLSLKYQGRSGAAAWMARRMAVLLEPEPTVLVPVPMSSTREKERGFNQAKLLALRMGRERDLRVEELLQRARFRQAQERLSAAERRVNVAGDFHLRPGVDVPERVTLVDDVCTTGATLEECARVLREAGVRELRAVVFARAGERR